MKTHAQRCRFRGEVAGDKLEADGIRHDPDVLPGLERPRPLHIGLVPQRKIDASRQLRGDLPGALPPRAVQGMRVIAEIARQGPVPAIEIDMPVRNAVGIRNQCEICRAHGICRPRIGGHQHIPATMPDCGNSTAPRGLHFQLPRA
jgi:hypothetical protein